MAIKKVAKLSEEEQMALDKAEILAEIDAAIEAARQIFGTPSPTMEMVYGILERLDGFEDEDAKMIVCEQLSWSVEAVMAKFGSAPVEIVFRHYDVFFEDLDEE